MCFFDLMQNQRLEHNRRIKTMQLNEARIKMVCTDLPELKCQYGKMAFPVSDDYDNQADFWLIEELDGWFLGGKSRPSNDILIIEFRNATVVVGCLNQYKTYLENPVISTECEYYYAHSNLSDSGEDSYGDHVSAHQSTEFGKDMDNISCNKSFNKLYHFVKKHMKEDERPIYHFPKSRGEYGYFDIDQDDFQILDRNGLKYQSKLQKIPPSQKNNENNHK